MEWIGIALGAIVIAVVAFLFGRTSGRNESKDTIGAYRTENKHLNKQVAELQAQVDLYGPKKKKELSPYASNRLKEALANIPLPSFNSKKPASVYGSRSGGSSFKPLAGRSSGSEGGFFNSFTLPAIINTVSDTPSYGGGGGYSSGDGGGGASSGCSTGE